MIKINLLPYCVTHTSAESKCMCKPSQRTQKTRKIQRLKLMYKFEQSLVTRIAQENAIKLYFTGVLSICSVLQVLYL
ncbi:hypothetical protein HanIR_Chr01g0026451 [Helianthus annuus]|nr:hypothetical protein HanIR_Chr01g0026451 [Helianthus annuus]